MEDFPDRPENNAFFTRWRGDSGGSHFAAADRHRPQRQKNPGLHALSRRRKGRPGIGRHLQGSGVLFLADERFDRGILRAVGTRLRRRTLATGRPSSSLRSTRRTGQRGAPGGFDAPPTGVNSRMETISQSRRRMTELIFLPAPLGEEPIFIISRMNPVSRNQSLHISITSA